MNNQGPAPRRRMTRIALIGVTALIALALTGCGTLLPVSYGEDSSSVESMFDMAPPEGTSEEGRAALSAPDADLSSASIGAGPDAVDVPTDERFIIRTVGLRVKVDDVETAVDSLRTEVERIGGIVTGLQVSTDDETPIFRYDALGSLGDGAPLKGYITVRVPAGELADFLETVDGLGDVLRHSSDEADVTQEHIDLSARLENLNSQEQRLREFFDRAETVEEMLDIERELGRVRGDIESLTAQIAYLERQAAMAMVTIELTGAEPVIRPSGTDWGFVDAITTGVRGLVGTINAMIIVAMSALPLVAVALLVWLIVRAVVRRRRVGRGVPIAESSPTGDQATIAPDDEGVHE